MEEGLRIRIERNKIKANRFFNNKLRVFIIDIDDTYYFCDITFIGDEGLHVKNFAGNLKYEDSRIFWEDIIKLEEYREKIE